MSPTSDDAREKVIAKCMEEIKGNTLTLTERNNIFDFLKREVSFNRYYELFREACPEL